MAVEVSLDFFFLSDLFFPNILRRTCACAHCIGGVHHPPLVGALLTTCCVKPKDDCDLFLVVGLAPFHSHPHPPHFGMRVFYT